MIDKTKIQTGEETCFCIPYLIRNTRSRCADVIRDEILVRDFFFYSSFGYYSEFKQSCNVNVSIKKIMTNNGMCKSFYW